eukprot:6463634-Amphidinium_carterae.2
MVERELQSEPPSPSFLLELSPSTVKGEVSANVLHNLHFARGGVDEEMVRRLEQSSVDSDASFSSSESIDSVFNVQVRRGFAGGAPSQHVGPISGPVQNKEVAQREVKYQGIGSN